jgi:hypothetical protein
LRGAGGAGRMSTDVPVRGVGLEAALAAREPDLVGLSAALGGEPLEELVSDLPARFRGAARVVHLRVKPGTSVQAAIEVTGPVGTRPSLLACYAPGDAAKAPRDAAYAHRHQLPSAWRPTSRTVLVPAAADRALRPHGRRLGTPGVRTRPVPGLPRGETTPLRHNPARRLVVVLESHGERWVLKAHASRGHGDHARRLAGAVPGWAVAPLAGSSRDGRVVAHRWVPGVPPAPAPTMRRYWRSSRRCTGRLRSRGWRGSTTRRSVLRLLPAWLGSLSSTRRSQTSPGDSCPGWGGRWRRRRVSVAGPVRCCCMAT